MNNNDKKNSVKNNNSDKNTTNDTINTNDTNTEDIETSTTNRATVSELDSILYKKFPVLDHGFIRVIDYMGCDSSIVQSARVSYGKGTKKTSQDKNLIRYLLRHRHTTPFEMCEIKFHIKLPIFVARQWIRHRTANVNECSGRYSIMSDDYYIPTIDQIAEQSKENNQGRGKTLDPVQAKQVQKILKSDAQHLYNNYNKLLNNLGDISTDNPLSQSNPASTDNPFSQSNPASTTDNLTEDTRSDLNNPDSINESNSSGIARELARINLSMNYYTEWYWKIDLHNLLHFIKLRIDSHAQYEIRCYAEILLDIIKLWVPYCYEAFCDYSLNAHLLSRPMLDVICSSLSSSSLNYENTTLSAREKKELESILLSNINCD